MKFSVNSKFYYYFLLVYFFVVFLQNKFEAIHNKDYSVVKPSRAGLCLVLFSSHPVFSIVTRRNR